MSYIKLRVLKMRQDMNGGKEMGSEYVPHWMKDNTEAVIYGILISLALLVTVIDFLIRAFAHAGLFSKAGEKVWKAFVPFYGEYTLYSISWKTNMFWIRLAISIYWLLFFFSFNRIIHIISSVSVVFFLYLGAKFSYRVSRSFGHGHAFAVGLFFLPYLFLLILAYGRSRYVGNSYIDDLIVSTEING